MAKTIAHKPLEPQEISVEGAAMNEPGTPTNAPEQLAIKHFPATRKALYDLASLFVTGPLRKEAKRPEVRAAVGVITRIALDMPEEPISETEARDLEAIRQGERRQTRKQRRPTNG
jgi:hypothetical protein